MRKITFIFCLGFFMYSCSGGPEKPSTKQQEQGEEQLKDAMKEAEKTEVHGTEVKEGDIKFSNPLDTKMIAAGTIIYDTKCSACHKLTDEKVVGPGWKDVTKRRKPTWIVNMITNVDMMLAQDAEAQKLLEQCLVRMPNQNVTAQDARNIIEFMRKNDGEK